MKHKFKLLVLAHDQFGYSVTKFKHCEHAREDFDITYVGWDYGLPKITLSNVNVHYVSRKSNILMRNLRLLNAFHNEIRKGYNLVFANYVIGIAVLKLLNYHSKFLLYIDTLAVGNTKLKRYSRNLLLIVEVYFFKNIALISDGIAKKIKVRKYHLLPIGGRCFSPKKKTFESLSLLYVGTLQNRNILDCVKGFHKYLEISDNRKSVRPLFTIVGDGPFGELEEINKYIHTHRLEPYIQTTGFLHNNELSPYFDKANIGVAYVPLKSYYQHQPPTKTFEYLISGLPIIATATQANKEIVTPDVCELIMDNSNSFYMGLVRMEKRMQNFSSEKIMTQYKKYTWKIIIKNQFVPLVELIAKM